MLPRMAVPGDEAGGEAGTREHPVSSDARRQRAATGEMRKRRLPGGEQVPERLWAELQQQSRCGEDIFGCEMLPLRDLRMQALASLSGPPPSNSPPFTTLHPNTRRVHRTTQVFRKPDCRDEEMTWLGPMTDTPPMEAPALPKAFSSPDLGRAVGSAQYWSRGW